MIESNYHTHTYLCHHAEGLGSDYIKKAIKLGYKEIGISDHGPLEGLSWIRMTKEQYKNIYMPDLEEAIKNYGDKIKIYKGLEIEFVREQKEYYKELLNDLDYLVLGQHFIMKNDKLHDVYHSLNTEEIVIYANTIVEAVNTGYFRILAHPDLFMYKYNKWDKTAEEVSKIIIEACIKNNVYIEINVNGARHGKILNEQNEKTWIYPRIEFLRLLQNYPDALIVINDDCHYLDHLYDETTIEVYNLIIEMGLKLQSKLF
ncbi:MAG: PHP domain-containing protein [Bacilli bacterium]